MTAAERRRAAFRELRRLVIRRLIVSEQAPWAGGVERRDPAAYQKPSQTLHRCRNPHCREWPLAGSRDAGRCLTCHTPLLEGAC